MKKHVFLLLLFFAALVQATSAAKVNPRVGKKLFDKVCRACHVEGTKAGELNPSMRTMVEWQQIIEKNKHRSDPEVVPSLTPEDKEALIMFLKRYASDYDY